MIQSFGGEAETNIPKILSRKQIILYLRKNNIIFMQSNIEGEGWRPKLRHPFVSIFARCTHVWISAEILNFNNFILSCNILICKHFLPGINYPEPWRAGFFSINYYNQLLINYRTNPCFKPYQILLDCDSFEASGKVIITKHRQNWQLAVI